jgi:hypothetical protein
LRIGECCIEHVGITWVIAIVRRQTGIVIHLCSPFWMKGGQARSQCGKLDSWKVLSEPNPLW